VTRGRRALWAGLALVVLAGITVASVFVWRARTRATGTVSTDGELIPTSLVTRGVLDLSVFATGDLRASRTVTLPAPSVGGTLRLLRLAEAGTSVNAGDVVMEFDPTEQQFSLEQAESQLHEAEQQAIKMHADVDVQAAQDQVELLTAKFDVRRAELDSAADKDLVSANIYEKNQIALDEARHRLAQLEADATARAATSRASLALADEKTAKARLSADRARQSIDSLIVKAPFDGMVAIRENRDASGGFFFSGMSLPEYRVGDTLFAGRPVADVVNLSTMEIHIRVPEQERTNIENGQTAVVRFDSLPGVPLGAKITAIAGLATGNSDTGGPLRQFDTTLQLDRAESRLRPGASVSVVVTGKRIERALVLPRQALLQKDGKSVVAVRTGGHFDLREVKVTYRTESRVAIEGLAEGTVVALVDPDSVRGGAATSPGQPAAGGSK
jgi:multidrug resistance efflux pump